MPKRYSTVEIVDGKVVFSKEVLEYFESIRNEENSEWIDKYFEYLSDEENLTADKYNGHHIIPCFTFKDETHRTRKETEPLADKIEGNIIKLSVYNHLLAHHCLWKIYNNWDSKNAIQKMCGQKKYTDDLTENELKEIAKIKENCAKKNRTEEEKKEVHKKWYEKNHDKLYNKERSKEYYKNNKERINKRTSEYQKSEKGKEIQKRYYQKHKNDEKFKENRKRQKAKESSKIQARNYAKEYAKTHKDKIHEKEFRECFDPIDNTFCTYNALRKRKWRNKEKYKNIILSECIIRD